MKMKSRHTIYPIIAWLRNELCWGPTALILVLFPYVSFVQSSLWLERQIFEWETSWFLLFEICSTSWHHLHMYTWSSLFLLFKICSTSWHHLHMYTWSSLSFMTEICLFVVAVHDDKKSEQHMSSNNWGFWRHKSADNEDEGRWGLGTHLEKAVTPYKKYSRCTLTCIMQFCSISHCIN